MLRAVIRKDRKVSTERQKSILEMEPWVTRTFKSDKNKDNLGIKNNECNWLNHTDY